MRAVVFMTLLTVCATGRTAGQQPDLPDSALFRLSRITVNAVRTPTSAFAVPLAVTVVNRQALEDRNGFRLDEAFEAVPGVLAQSRYGTSDVRIVIRGFGARGAGDRSNAGTTRGIRILQDGFPETEPDGRTAFDLVDLSALQGVEVIRSNASALWGNAAGGLINFVSAPAFQRPFASYEQNLGGFGLKRELAQAGAQLGDSKLAVSVIRTDYDGWRQNSSSDRSLINVGLAAPLGDDTDLRLHVLAADNSFEIPGPLSQAAFESDPRQANATYLQRRERRRNRIGRVGTAIEHRFTEGQSISGALYVNPKYLQRSERGTFRDFTRYHIGGNLVFRDQRTLSPSVGSTLTIGTDEAYQDGAILFYRLTPQGERDSTLTTDKREGANNFGVFAQEQLSFGEHLEITLGARYDNITYYADDYFNPRLNAQRSFTRVTPKLGLLYRPSSDHSFYANVGGGVEAPAGNETDPVQTFGTDTITALNPLLEPIRSTTFEVGTKQLTSTSGFVRAISYDAAVYLTNVTNEIVPYRGGRFYFTAAKARRMGAELGLDIETTARVSLATALALSDNRYREYQVDSVHYNLSLARHYADYSDNKVVGVPDFFGSATVRYSPRQLEAIEVGVGVQHVGEFFADDANVVAVPDYSLFSASLGLRRPLRLTDAIDVRGFVRIENLTDENYVASAFLNPDVVGGVPLAFEPGMPRHVFVSLSLGLRR